MIRYKTITELEKDFPVLADFLDSLDPDLDMSDCETLADLLGGDVHVAENLADM